VFRKTIIGAVSAWVIGVLIVSQATEEKETSSQNVPEVCTLGTLSKIYEPVLFSHGQHTLMAEDCATCHHHSEPGVTLACKECHGAPFDPKNLNMPGLKGAYHLQCMGCHQQMSSGPVGCTDCHAKRISQQTGMEKK